MYGFQHVEVEPGQEGNQFDPDLGEKYAIGFICLTLTVDHMTMN